MKAGTHMAPIEITRPFIKLQPDVWKKDGPLPYPVIVLKDATIGNADALGGKYTRIIGFCHDPEKQVIDLTYPSFVEDPQKAVGMYTVVADDQARYFTMGGPIRDVEVTPARQCYYVFETSFVDGKGYIPSLVTENQGGHQPMSGDGTQQPWYWGMTLGEARKTARQVNEETFKLTRQDVNEIVTSSFRAAFDPQGNRR